MGRGDRTLLPSGDYKVIITDDLSLIVAEGLYKGQTVEYCVVPLGLRPQWHLKDVIAEVLSESNDDTSIMKIG